jgi:hypothetical protein
MARVGRGSFVVVRKKKARHQPGFFSPLRAAQQDRALRLRGAGA